MISVTALPLLTLELRKRLVFGLTNEEAFMAFKVLHGIFQ